MGVWEKNEGWEMGDVGCGMWEERGERREEMHSKLHITHT